MSFEHQVGYHCIIRQMKENHLADLHPASKSYDDVKTHVVFVHGLSGHFEKTWTAKEANPPALWPNWLSEDIAGIGIWLVGYPAAKTNWSGHGMPLSDRADNILARLLVEPRLERGNIVFVAHSLGGLVVEQLLRNALRDSGSNRKAENLLSRVRRVAYLGTPHRGAILANIGKLLRLIIRPSAAARDLVLGSPQLRDLNYWYRKYSHDNAIENLVLAEGRPERLFCINLPEIIGTIVSLSSADGGLPTIPISVDESHTTICKPSSRDSDVYVHLKSFIGRDFDRIPQVTQIVEAIERNTTQLEQLEVSSQSQNEAITSLTRSLENNAAISTVDKAIIDAEVARQLDRLRKCRLFAASNTMVEVRKFIISLKSGGLALASKEVKDEALAWCSRLLSTSAPDEAQLALDVVSSPEAELATIARGLIEAGRGRLEEALSVLALVDTPISRGAAYISVLKANGFGRANAWLKQVELSVDDLDSDAKFFYLSEALSNGHWNNGLEVAAALTDADVGRTPILLLVSADAHLMKAVPDELRTFLMQYLPFDAATFPLRSEPENITHRRTAASLYARMSSAAAHLGMPIVAGYSDDRALWLQLMDPETANNARDELSASIKDPATLLRRLNLALQFGVQIDLMQVEKEVDRQTALFGGNSLDAAVARFALASAQKDYVSAAAYAERHREQLLKHLEWKGIYFFEVEMLAKSGQIAQAQARLREATERGITDDEAARLHRMLAEVAGSDPISERITAYEKSKSIADLRLLVEAYEEVEDWEKIAEYGKSLLHLTGDIADAYRHAIALYNIERLDELLAVIAAYPALMLQFKNIRLLQAQTLYGLGDIAAARLSVHELRQVFDTPSARQLQINIAIVSGDWESLQGFVESEWGARADRTAIELLRAGQIAQSIGAVRGKELVREAAQRAPDDPKILLGCYFAASAIGWEDNPGVHQWLEQGAAYSEKAGDGVIEKMTIEDLIERNPGWQERETNTLSLVASGEAPLFAAGQLLNRSLLSFTLFPALSNLSEADVRKRPLIYAFSGARVKQVIDPRAIALDPTALITAEFLGVLDLSISAFERVIIPHATLGWLLEEKAKILFHQPSRVAAAHELRRMISQGQLHSFDSSSIPVESLVKEVGEGLATLISEASTKKAADEQQRLVVRGGPVHKVSTFMKEEADLAGYEPYLCSSFDVVQKLAQKGVLTAPEVDRALTALQLREKPWPHELEIQDGAVLYLDDLAVSHLEFLGLLPRLHRAGITAVVSRSEIEEADALIAYDAKSSEVVTIVDRIRTRVRDGLECGKIQLGRTVRAQDEEGSERVKSHPTLDIFKLMVEVDAIVIDDRSINQHASISLEAANSPLLTTLDILDTLERRGVLSAQRKQEAMTTLRRAGFALVPLDCAEMSKLINAAPVTNGILSETAELRAIRESILRIRMSEVLQIPKEIAWLNSMVGTCILALKDQWKEGVDEPLAVARSEWLLELGDVKGWTHRLNEESRQLVERYGNWVAMLMRLPVAQPETVKAAYWRWLESSVLAPIAEDDPETYSLLIKHSKTLFSYSIESLTTKLDAANE